MKASSLNAGCAPNRRATPQGDTVAGERAIIDVGHQPHDVDGGAGGGPVSFGVTFAGGWVLTRREGTRFMHDDIRDAPAPGVSGAVRVSRPLVVDLFAGAGLFSHAFVEEGFEVVQAVENDPFAVESYRANLGDVVDAVDIVDATPAERCDVLIGGPPCQGFSTLGKRDPGDARNRLGLELLRWV